MSGMASAGRCVERDGEGRRCILAAGHRTGRHIGASHSFLLGKLQQAAKMHLAGRVDREFLAATLAETESEAS